MEPDRSARSGDALPLEPTPDTLTVDADRLLEDPVDAELAPPLEAPIDAPIDDLIDQRRTVTLEEPDDH